MNRFRKVLIIDDDPVLRAMVHEYFQKHGAEHILEAGDGMEALEHIEREGAGLDLILSDLNMPRLDGVELINRLRDMAYTGPIVIISGTFDVVITMAQELAGEHQLNIAGTIYKPFSADKLDEIIAEMSDANASA